MKKMLLLAGAILIGTLAQAQKLEIKLHYEDRPNVSTWWKANNQVHFSLDDQKKHQYNKSSKVCLKVRWDSIWPNLAIPSGAKGQPCPTSNLIPSVDLKWVCSMEQLLQKALLKRVLTM